MINELLVEIDEIIRKYKLHIGTNISYIAYLIHLKYLIETNEYTFDEVISNDYVYPLNRESKRIVKYDNNKFPINRLLLNIKNISSKELLLELLNYQNKPLYLHDENKSIAYLNIENNLYEYYNPKGNSTYIMKTPEYYETFKVFDKILNINNNYISFRDIEKEEYSFDYIYIYDNTLRFSKSSDSLLETIENLRHKTKNIILIARYSKISNFREGRFLTRYIKTIILDDKQAIIHFQRIKEDDEITIINTDNIKDKNKIQSIIKSNRKQKDILLKIKVQDIRDNNYRIGFNLYKLEKTNKIKDINKIVDENTNYLEKLNRINQTVEQEINKLLNR